MIASLSEEKIEEYQKFAIDLALKAGQIMKQNFLLDIPFSWKKDNSPITTTDNEINQMVLDAVKEKYPDQSVIAEEGSNLIENSEFAWVCDPLDGTIPFSSGYPIFTFSLALVKNGEPLLGIIHDPISNRLFRAIKGKSAFLNDKRVFVSSEKKISKTSLINVSCDSELLSLREALIKKTSCRVSVLHSTTYASLLVASEKFLAEIYENKTPWDAAAAKVIIEGAGGKFTDLFGKEQRYDRKINGYIASNNFVHQELLTIVSSVLKKSKS